MKLLFLTVPLQVTTWIIDDNQIRGDDFTMDGTPIRIDKVKLPEEVQTQSPVKKSPTQKAQNSSIKKARVLSLGGKKKSTES